MCFSVCVHEIKQGNLLQVIILHQRLMVNLYLYLSFLKKKI